MLKSAGVTIICFICASLMTGCGMATKTNQTYPEPQSTSVSVEEAEKTDIGIDTIIGTYTGQIDNNSIEVKINGLPDESAYRAYAFSEEIKTEFEKMELNPNEIVKIKYREREKQQPLILAIERTSDEYTTNE